MCLCSCVYMCACDNIDSVSRGSERKGWVKLREGIDVSTL